jgi:glycosyltransferase involved in cell wall biosynthesis
MTPPHETASSASRLPRRLLYTTSARIGGRGLDEVVVQSLKLSAGRFLGQAIAFENRQDVIPSEFIRSLAWHPVRLLSGLGSQRYYGAKKQYLDWIAARELARGRYDLLHTWSGDCVRTLRAATRMGVPSLLEIPTWHRHKGKVKTPQRTMSERALDDARWPQRWLNRLLVSRQQVLEEYALADLILVLSQKAEETFLAAGVPPEKLFRHQRGVDVQRFTPAPNPPEIFRAVFVGALIKRKGVHHLLDAWRRVNLRNAELVLVGAVHPEIRPFLEEFGGSGVQVAGYVSSVEEAFRASTVHVLPSECEGSAKATYEAAACGLPQITTRESGDVVEDEVSGLIIPPNDPDAIATALRRLHDDPALRARMGAAGRQRVVERFTWEHFRARLLAAYETAHMRRSSVSSQ